MSAGHSKLRLKIAVSVSFATFEVKVDSRYMSNDCKFNKMREYNNRLYTLCPFLFL